ncbi:MAG TPA: 1-acyl-sn-glycerol-3-phosphate acyltransferase [Cryomorphaceae bacterium]|nr:1-acyl-sn-glycerol-3-phosphate acyltransferase [Cryomorphaceae bacterium]
MISKLFVWLCVRWFKLSGWHISKAIPSDLRNYVLVVAPHTSNIDFFVGVAARRLMGINVKYLAKKELFVFPIKSLLLNLGGYPVNRAKNMSLVDFVVDKFRRDPDFAITVTPEGTRGLVDKWKSGFYHIAVKADVPIVMVGFDYQRKWVISSEPFLPTGDMQNDFNEMYRFFEKIIPRHPKNAKYPL